jgi:hypothetical protein
MLMEVDVHSHELGAVQDPDCLDEDNPFGGCVLLEATFFKRVSE